MSVLPLPLWLVDKALRLCVKRSLAKERSPQAMRERLERGARLLFHRPSITTLRDDRLEQGGHSVPALWAETGGDDAPVLLYLHGGAYLAGSARTHVHLAAALAAATGARACLPDYRLAPEHPFPAAPDDALTAYRALLARGIEATRILLAGDSAGGGLAAALLLAAQDAGLPRPAALALFSPWTDLTGKSPALSANAHSDAMLPPHRMPDVTALILQGAEAAQPLASPALGRFVAPPPSLITVGAGEILLGDAQRLAQALETGGGHVALKVHQGLPHAWPFFRGYLRAADQTIAEAGRFLRRALSTEA
ncbi:MAG: alpha/beta hydrolase fold domain-containing protein [Pseudomonadota bacterium]